MTGLVTIISWALGKKLRVSPVAASRASIEIIFNDAEPEGEDTQAHC